MADSNITKKALASALKELMETMPFAKISVGDICERCEMNRKSFYYHFKDKEDLANWIFDVEFLEYAMQTTDENALEKLEKLVFYFYNNRSFYRKLLKHEGQNSFAEHFSEIIHPVLVNRLQAIVGANKSIAFYVNFFSGGIVCALKRWLTDPNCESPETFISEIESCVYLLSKHNLEKFESKKES